MAGLSMRRSNDDDLLFRADKAPDACEAQDLPAGGPRPWGVLIADDDEGVHSITKVVLQGVRFGDRPLELISAYSAAEARVILQERADIAVLLLDVVMEHDSAGLALVREIRDTMKNQTVRIILRTGQPGQAPEREVILKYDINDYKSKSELTAQKLFSATISALRAFSDITALKEAHRQVLSVERARANLARYFSPNLADHLAREIDHLALGGERRDLTVLTTDLEDFTAMVERLDPTVVVPLMNEYLAHAIDIVFAHGGTVDSLMGDAVHAIFGAPADQPDHARRAIDCALALDTELERLRARKRAEGIAMGCTRIGIHSGSAVVGNFGRSDFFHYTAIGDTVNTASRLEAANKSLGTRICVSAPTVAMVADFVGRPVGTLVLRGKAQGIAAFEPSRPDDGHAAARAMYVAAFEKMTAGDPGALQGFAALVGAGSGDPLATFHLKRLLAGETSATINLVLN
ncbi:MAG: response regulator [Alphaproteobacteria bacterium]|nr:response regulator [Alphaproteobacteria bacterium]